MNDKTNAASDGAGDLMRLWLDASSHIMDACQTWAGAAVSPEAFRQSRSNMFKMWSDTWEKYLRSSSFLEMQKRCLAGSVEFKKQSREMMERFSHELQLASSGDMEQLIVTMRRLEDDMRERLEQVDSRLNSLSNQIEALSARLRARERKARTVEPAGSSNGKGRKTNRRGKTSSRAR